MRSRPKSTRRITGACAVVFGAGLVTVAGTAVADADEPIGTAYPWASERTDDVAPLDDPWIFRGPTDYQVAVQPACVLYPGHQRLVADVSVTAPDRFEPFPFDPDALFFPVRDTVTIDWTDPLTGETGRVVAHGDNGTVPAGVFDRSGRLELDIHLRSDHPWLQAVGSSDLDIGHAEGTVHTVVDLTDKTCG